MKLQLDNLRKKAKGKMKQESRLETQNDKNDNTLSLKADMFQQLQLPLSE